jgi:hypothetical protein
MSATSVAPATGRSEATPGAPVPRRVRVPGWLDLRLLLGVLLVLGSVLIGARVVTAADATVPVWSVAGDLAAGTVLDPSDLVAVSVRLEGSASAYLATSTHPAGRVLGRAVRAGELLPRSALEEATGLVQLALPVQSGYVPPSLARGQLVDVYAVAAPSVGATGQTGGDVDLVVSGAPVQAVTGRGDGVLSTATTTVQVVIAVPAEDAAGVLGSIGGRGLVVVVRNSVDGAAAAAGGRPPVTGPAGPTG